MSDNSPNWQQRSIPKLKHSRYVSVNEQHELEETISCPICFSQSTVTVIHLNSFVCPNCDHHLPIKARLRLEMLFDEVEATLGEQFKSHDPLKFVDSKPYPKRLAEAQSKTSESEALLVMVGSIQHLQFVACAFEFDFMGGSMGSVVGDRFVEACHYALAHRLPLVCFAASGGARMQEGVLSLLQMARTSAAIEQLKMAGLPYIVVLTNPCYGGVTASLAMLGDIHLAEPKAMIGFAGRRVIETTVRQTLSDDFQKAEYLEAHGMIDQIVHRHELKHTIARLLAKMLNVKAV